MTYGWALLVVLIAIGALAFFGVLNPSKFLPTQCVLGPGLACEDFKIVKGTAAEDDDDRIFINVRNGMGKDFDYFYIYLDKSQGSEVCGGFIGVIAHPDPNFGMFKDGDARQVQAIASVAGISPGINCNRNWLTLNCCNVDVIYQICVSSSSCVPSCNLVCGGSSELPKTGSKFSGDIVIVYKELGSAIIHQRVGRLTAQIE